jgi:hypothetical protein
MKAPSLLSAFLFPLFATAALAIPTNIGGFNNLANMNFEDFASLGETWKPGVQPKATWEMWKSPDVTDTTVELLRLTCSATIFGIPAAEVTAQRRDDQTFRFDAVFVPTKGAKLEPLDRTLRRNLAAWAEKATANGFRAGATDITVATRLKEGNIRVSFTPASGQAVTSR